MKTATLSLHALKKLQANKVRIKSYLAKTKVNGNTRISSSQVASVTIYVPLLVDL